jgi:hypothetical protein
MEEDSNTRNGLPSSAHDVHSLDIGQAGQDVIEG